MTSPPHTSRAPRSLPHWGWGIVAFGVLAIGFVATIAVIMGIRAFTGRGDGEPAPTFAVPTPELKPGLQISPDHGAAGSIVVVSGQGWPADDSILIGLAEARPGVTPSVNLGRVEAVASSNAAGAFEARFIMPSDQRLANLSSILIVAQSASQNTLVRWQSFGLDSPTTPVPPETAIPSPTTPAAGCTDQVAFVADVTIQDGTVLAANQNFQKIWRLRNAGTCTWTTGYALVHVSGSRLSGPARQALTAEVAPGSTVDLKVNLTSPIAHGTYTGFWMLSDEDGEPFGFGANADRAFWVKILVGPYSAPSYGAWVGQYFDNDTLSGSPDLVRDDNLINFDWKHGSPGTGIPSDNFSARWTGKVDFDAATYRFKVWVDDGVRLYIDDQLVLDEWEEGAVREHSVEVGLTKATHTLRLEYFEAHGTAVVRFAWEKVGSPNFPDWKAQYYNNRDLSGAPVLTRNDRNIDFSWGKSAPSVGVTADNFSVRWTRRFNFEDGTYRLRVRSDDGVRVYVDGSLVINEWRDQAARTYTYDMRLSGAKTIVVEYYEHSGDALISFVAERLVPATSTPTGTSSATATATGTNTPTTTATSVSTETVTEPPPTGTASPTATQTEPSATPEDTATPTPTASATPTATPTEPAAIVLIDFTESLCAATWSNGAGTLDCPGTPGDSPGSVYAVDDPSLENGMAYGGQSGIAMKPEAINHGTIRGTYPAVTLQAGDHFLASVGCLQTQSSCNLELELGYILDGESIVRSLGAWQETFDGEIQDLEIDLSSLAGQSVRFVLAAYYSASPSPDGGFWLAPRIMR